VLDAKRAAVTLLRSPEEFISLKPLKISRRPLTRALSDAVELGEVASWNLGRAARLRRGHRSLR
jgi:hypothetical protein